MIKRFDWLVFIFIVVVSVVILKDLYKPGVFSAHDIVHNIVRFYYFDEAVRDGQIPPRWANGLLNGFGYPIFIFSYQMPWLIAEPIHLLGFSIIDSVKLTFLAGFILSGLTMYFFQKSLFNRLSAFLGTVVYLFAPFRFSNIFVRAAIGDATSFIFSPLLFLSMYKLKTKSKHIPWWIIIGGFALASLLLSHALVFFFYLIALTVYVFFSVLSVEDKLTYFKNSFFIGFIAFGLSSYYLIPSIAEKNFTIFSSLLTQMIQGGGVFVTLRDLIYSPWGYGTFHSREGAMSIQIGFTQWLILSLALLTVIISFTKKRIKVDLRNEALIYLVIIFISFLLMFPVSLPFWTWISKYVVIDFPWRAISVIVFCISFLAGFIANSLNSRKTLIIFVTVITVVALYANRNNIRINQTLSWDLPFLLRLEKTTNSFDEYTPKWITLADVKIPKPRVDSFTSDTKITLLKTTSADTRFNMTTTSCTPIRINTIFYPGWNLYINGQKQLISFKNHSFLDFSISQYRSLIEAKFEETRLRLLSDIASLCTIIISLLVIYRNIKFKS